MSPERQTKLFASIFILGVGFTILFLMQTPKMLKAHIEDTYSGVTVNAITYRAWYIQLKLSVDKGWVRAELPDVRVNMDKEVTVHGGHINILKLPEGGSAKSAAPSRKITVDGVMVHYKGHGAEVTLNGVSTEHAFKTPVTWLDGTVEHAHANARIGPGKAGPSKKDIITAKQVVISPKFEIPEMTDGSIFLDDVTFELIKGDPTLQVKRWQAGGSYGANGSDTEIVYDRDIKMLFFTFGTITVTHPIISKQPMSFPHGFILSLPTDDFEAIKRGDVDIYMKPGWNDRFDSVDFWFNIANMQIRASKASCQDYIKALPTELAHPLDGMTFVGDLEWSMTVKPEPKLKMTSTCKAICGDKLKALRKPFTYEAYKADGVTRFTRTSGPGSKDWVPIGAVGQYLPIAAITLEDPGFNSHRGVSVAALRNSLIDNVKKGRFVRGGSTIQMQLARNLWLSRGKTLGRKIQEIFLAWALQSCLSRERILELYLNVVEYAPDTYGIGNGTRKWFDKHAEALLPVEAFYLIKRLPRPGTYPPPSDATMDRITKLMGLFVKTEKIPSFWVPQDHSDLDLSEWHQ